MDNTEDLRVLLASRHPLIVAASTDEARFLTIVRRCAAELDLPVWTWSATRGLARDGNDPQYLTGDPQRALDWIGVLESPGVFVMADVHPALDDPLVVRGIKEVAQRARPGQTLVLTGPDPRTPPELQSLAVPWTLRPPDAAELEKLVRRTVADLTQRGIPVNLDDTALQRLADGLRGLSMGEAERIVQRAACRDGGLSGADYRFVLAAKAELLNVDGVLELIESDVGTLDEVGGLDGIKAWLRQRRDGWLAGGRDLGLDPPRGIMLTGIPGCGKSLVAKTLARTWEVPLILLDPGRLFGRYVGESEERLRRALAAVDAMAPVVLWIDEIEKGFSGGHGDGGVARRLFGTFLRWMQDRSHGVFLVATANDVAALPPELARKGRFDEVFFVDLPDVGARRGILAIHLERRGQAPDAFAVDELAAASDGFSGAEIEAAVVGGLYRAIGEGRAMATADILAEIEQIIPLSVSRAEEIAALRAWAQVRTLAA